MKETENTSSYFSEIEKEMKSPLEKLASKNKRFFNQMIDGFFAFLFFLFCSILLSNILDFIYFFGSGSRIQPNLFLSYLICYLLYYTAMEFFWGRTVGKLITKTYVVDLKGDKPKLKTIFLRSLLRLIPIDALSYMDNVVGLHDSLSKTRVVEE